MASRSVFDGRSLTLYRSDGSIVGSWPAISGKNGDQRPSSQNRPFEGPLTEGKYSFSTDNIQPMTTLDAAKGVVGRGLFPKSVPAWGTERAALVPESKPTNGRGNFFIHGGVEPGSAGCIDLGPNEKAYFDAVRSTGESSHEVIVSYDPSLETSRHPLAGRRFWDGASEYLPRIVSLPEQRLAIPAVQPDAMHSPRSFVDRFETWGTSPAGTPERELDHPASLDQRFGNWGTRYAGGAGASNFPPVGAPDFVGPGIPFVSMPAGSLVAPEESSLLDSAPMDPARLGPFSTGGRFVPRSSLPQPLYPTGPLVPASNTRMQDRQGSLEDRSGNWNSSPAEDADRFRSPVLRELQMRRQLAAAGVAAAPSSAAPSLGIPRAQSRVGSGAGDVMGGVFKWIGSDLIPSVEVSPSKLRAQGGAAPDFVGDSGGAVSNASEVAPLSAKDNRRYLTKRVVGQESVFDAGAPAVPFVPSNAGLAPDYPNSFEDRFGNWSSTGAATQPARQQQASTPPGLFTGQPMPNRIVALPIFDLLNRSTGREGSADERESQGTGIPMLDEYIRYLNREYPS